MAQLRLQPPEPFNFRTPDDWPRWRRRFEQFRVASGLGASEATQQVSTLLYCVGEEAEAVLASTGITADERKEYDTVVKKFDDFFKVRRNVIFERARFNRRNQQEGETAEKYIMELYTLADNCNYGDLRDEMIRDRLVVGIRDAALSRQLQLDAELTLEKAKTKVRQREAVAEQQKVLKLNTPSAGLEEVHSRKRFTPNMLTTGDNADMRAVAAIVTAKREIRPRTNRALGVEEVLIPVNNALPKTRHVIAATRKDITEHSA